MNLTPYEQDVLNRLANGEIPKRIASALNASDEAIYSCVKNINKKARRAGFRWARVLVKAENHGR